MNRENKNEDVLEYWTGADIPYKRLWDAYNSGKDGYSRKFQSLKFTLIRIEFSFPPVGEPIFNLEAVYKSFKGIYWDFKNYCLTDASERNEAAPIFIYSIERGSSIWTLMVESGYAVFFLDLLARATLHWMQVYHEGIKIIRDSEKLEEERDKRNKEREKKNQKKIDSADIEKLIEADKSALINLLRDVKEITFIEPSKEKIIMRFDTTPTTEAAPKEAESKHHFLQKPKKPGPSAN